MSKSLVEILESQLKESGEATNIYKLRLTRTIERLKTDYYRDKDEILIVDLESLGFVDIGRQMRKGLYN